MAVVVLGAAKSGTSAVSGVLSRMGVNFGDDLRSADHRNPRGYFEDRTLLRLNDDILAAAGGSAWSPPTLGAVRAVIPHFAEEVRETVSMLTARGVTGWKVTTFTLTIDHFAPHLPDLRTVLVVRDPLEVARSAIHHRGISEEHALRTQAAYLAAGVEQMARYDPSTVVSYGDLRGDTRSVVEGLARFCGLDPSARQLRAAVRHVASTRRIRAERVARGRLISARRWLGNAR